MSAQTLATQPAFVVGRYRTRLKSTTELVSADQSGARAPSVAAAGQDTVSVRLTGASMRLLEVSLAVAAIATALLAGIGR